MFERNLGIVVGSHLNDAMIEISINPTQNKIIRYESVMF